MNIIILHQENKKISEIFGVPILDWEVSNSVYSSQDLLNFVSSCINFHLFKKFFTFFNKKENKNRFCNLNSFDIELFKLCETIKHNIP